MAKARRDRGAGAACGSGFLPRAGSGRCSASPPRSPSFACGVLGYYYVQFSRIIEARLHGERDRVIPRVFARPLVAAQRPGAERNRAGRAAQRRRLHRKARASNGPASSRSIGAPSCSCRAAATRPASPCASRLPNRRSSKRGAAACSRDARSDRARRSRRPGASTRSRSIRRCSRDWSAASREKRRRVPLATIPARMQQAVLAIEDRRFYAHPGIDPISVVGAVCDEPVRRSPPAGGTQHAHAAALAHVLPERGVQRRAAVGPAVVSPQGARSLHGDDSRDEGDQGRDSRALSERRLSRQPRLVCAARRRRSGADLLRQGRQQPDAVGSRADRRRHPESVSALAVRQSRALEGAAQPGAVGDGRSRFHHARSRRSRVRRSHHRRRARRRQRGALLRRLPQRRAAKRTCPA